MPPEIPVPNHPKATDKAEKAVTSGKATLICSEMNRNTPYSPDNGSMMSPHTSLSH
jgi:hypothetical protein